MKEVQEARRIIMLHQPSKVSIESMVLFNHRLKDSLIYMYKNKKIIPPPPCVLVYVMALFGLIYL
jgi:hypothetical protein